MKKSINNKTKGFTIVELLVVIVVIGILAAISIVSYTGVTARANTEAAKSAASSVIEKINIAYADGTITEYPKTFEDAILASDFSQVLTGVTVQAQALEMSKPDKASTIRYEICGYKKLIASPYTEAKVTAGTTISDINDKSILEMTGATPLASPTQEGVLTGVKVIPWDFSKGVQGSALTAGITSGGKVTCYPTAK